MRTRPKIYADFNNADPEGRIRLLESSHEDITRLKLKFKEGMEIEIEGDNLSADGIVRFSDTENIWIAEIDWKKLRYHDE